MFRVGMGYDVHRLIGGRPLVIGGVTISSELGLDGHSDADVLSHAIADALLGSIGEKDIGHHFPNTDASIEGISSLKILERVKEILTAAGAKIVNVDSTIVAERPKIGPYLDEMKAALGGVLGLPPNCIGVKATTNERLGTIGRGEGIAAFAVASVEVA